VKKKGRKKELFNDGNKESNKQDMQCTCNVIFWHLSLTIVATENQYLC